MEIHGHAVLAVLCSPATGVNSVKKCIYVNKENGGLATAHISINNT